MELKLELKAVTKQYGKVTALNQVSVSFAPGIYGLLGPNGAGKSTFMKIITETIRQTGGEVLFCDKEIAAWKDGYREALGYMPQQQGMYEMFTARRFLAYMAALKGIAKAEIPGEIDRVLQLVHLSDVADRKLGTFSGGMKQRILIAQAVLGNPKILILDEPTAGLDPKERIRIRNMISQLSRDKIVLIATHVVSDIEFIADHIVLMKKGNILGNKTPAEWLRSLQGMVYEIPVEAQQVQAFEEQHLVCNIRKDEEDVIWVRTILEEAPEESAGRVVPPTLEDLYLYMFREGETVCGTN